MNMYAREFIAYEVVSERGVGSERDEDRICEQMMVTLDHQNK